MIVKNEKAVICRCLASLKPYITYWVIVDTGSSDGTQEIIRNFMKEIPGELHERPWVDFAHNRNEALALAKNKADYIFFMDADDVLEVHPNFQWTNFDKDFYYVNIKYAGMEYSRVNFIKSSLNWKWTGVLHEVIESTQARIFIPDPVADMAIVVNTDGARSKDPQKYLKDAKVLEKALEKEPNSTRNQFYLAQSYKDAELYKEAIEAYQKRVDMGGWDQEVYISLLKIAGLRELLKEPDAVVHESYKKAYEFRPSRLETLYYLTRFERKRKRFAAGYEAALKGLFHPHSKDLLFVESSIYDYGLLLEFSVCAYWCEKYLEAKLASKLLLANEKLPQDIRELVQRNLCWIDGKLAPE